jgi:hypothetical protein
MTDAHSLRLGFVPIGLVLASIMLVSQIGPCFAQPNVYFYGYFVWREDNIIGVHVEVQGILSSDDVRTEMTIIDIDAGYGSQQTRISVHGGPGSYDAFMYYPVVSGHLYSVQVFVTVPNHGGWAPNYCQSAHWYVRL